MKLLMDYTVMRSPDYDKGKFRYFKGETGAPTDVVDPPVDTGLDDFIKDTDEDPVVFSFMDGSQPLALACIVTTDFSVGTSTGRYYLCKPTIVDDTITWSLVAGGTNGIRLVVGRTEVAGNPHGVAQVGTNLYIVDYDVDADDITNIYTVSIAALKAATTGGNVTVTPTPVTLPSPPPGVTVTPHGNGLIALTQGNSTYLYALYIRPTENASHMPTSYETSVVVRLNPSSMGTGQTVASVGKNAMGMVPVQGGTPTGLFIAVPCLGGKYQYGTTNGTDSVLFRVDDIFDPSMTATAAITGVADTVPDSATCDIKSVAFSENGLYGYLLCLTYDANYAPCWKIYKTTAADILTAANVSIGNPGSVLTYITGQDSATGNDWELLYENAADPANGRLWFVQGTVIEVSKGDYSDPLPPPPHDFEYLYDVSARGYVNSADLIGEMIYQYGKGHSIDTRLIKGKTAAKIARAAARAAAAAPEEEEEEK